MDRLTKTLLASLGGGILLGTGLKLGEALSSGALARTASSSDDQTARRILRRIRHIEARLESFEARPGGSSREGKAATHLRSLQAQMAMLEREIGQLGGEPAERVAHEGSPPAEGLVSSLADSIQARVINRIVKLEEETASQSTALRELQACTVKTEKSVQRLIAGLDRWLSSQPLGGHREE